MESYYRYKEESQGGIGMTSKNPIMEINHIYKHFTSSQGKLQVLEDISLKIEKDEIVALVGPSGCGKTTLLNIIAGLISADQGELKIAEALRLGYIFQEPRLLPWNTVVDNISFVQENFLSVTEAQSIRERLLHATGLWADRDAYPAQLSGGMKQRLEFVRALAIKPDLLLMDEPFKSLDIALKYQLQELLLAEYSRDSFAILFITHDPEEAVMLADRVIVISQKPARISREFRIAVAREERSLKDDQLYQILEDILAIVLAD